MLFLHGFLGMAEDWQPVIEKMSDDFYCLAVDLPGHGETVTHGALDDYTMTSVAVTIYAFLNQLNVRNISLVGYSMGGRLALYLAVSYPAKWRRVVLESVSPGLHTEKERQQRLQKDIKLAKKMESTNFDQFLREWYQQPLFQSILKHKDFHKLLIRRLENQPEKVALALQGMSLGNQPSFWAPARNLDIPLLLIAGEYDRKFRNILGEFDQYCAHSQYLVIKQAGHNTHFEQPLAFYRQIDKFLRR